MIDKDFNNKVRQFIKFLSNDERIQSSIRNVDINNYFRYFTFRLVPKNINIGKPTTLIKYCKMFGLELKYEYNIDELRERGYRDYIDCYCRPNDSFYYNKVYLVAKEVIKNK